MADTELTPDVSDFDADDRQVPVLQHGHIFYAALKKENIKYLKNIAADTAENRPRQVCCMIWARAPDLGSFLSLLRGRIVEKWLRYTSVCRFSLQKSRAYCPTEKKHTLLVLSDSV